MSLALRRAPRMRVADFIAMIRDHPDEERWELLDGEALPMAPPGEPHQHIVMDLGRQLATLADQLGCWARPAQRFPRRLRAGPRPRRAMRPASFRRLRPRPLDRRRGAVTLDHERRRGRKAAFYQGLQTLRADLIVYQDEARVEVWSRGNGPDWSLRVLGRDDTIQLPDLDGQIPVAALYDGIPL